MTMIRIKLAALAAILLMVGFTTVHAAEEDHVALAIEHTHAAIKAGKANDGAALVQHAKVALQHAQAETTGEKIEHTKVAITHLELAIEQGRDDPEAGTKHASEALKHLEMAE